MMSPEKLRKSTHLAICTCVTVTLLAGPGCSRKSQSTNISTDMSSDSIGIEDSDSIHQIGGFDTDTSTTMVQIPTDSGANPLEFEECAAVAEDAENTREPADIIFVIDNSKSLYDEIEMVRANMNDFSERIMNSGIDPQIVMISCLPGDCGNRGGVSYGICIDPPLGAEDGCQYVSDTPDTEDPKEPVTPDSNLPRYKHLSVRVPSMKELEWLVTTYEDNNGLTEAGWHDMIRDDSMKHIVVVSDDGDQTTAEQFNESFQALSPLLGNYLFHGIFAFAPKDEAPADSQCSTYAAPSSPDAIPPIYWDTYSNLVAMTGGVSGDLCEQDFNPVFEALGSSVIASSKINCEWEIPAPPTGETLDAGLVNVEFSSQITAPYVIGNIPAADRCADVEHGWYYDNPAAPTQIKVCPNTCTWFQSEADAHLTIQFGCETQTVVLE
ncbi:MAG: hypothetical protein JXR76_26685 [Deltaproteobacteria bacterium]|nr:hypothetical protein [Deltaproteobacteria bacterium]